MRDHRRDRAGDEVRREAYRLAIHERLGAAEIEARLVASGFSDVSSALDGIRQMLDAAATAPRSEREGIITMFGAND